MSSSPILGDTRLMCGSHVGSELLADGVKSYLQILIGIACIRLASRLNSGYRSDVRTHNMITRALEMVSRAGA